MATADEYTGWGGHRSGYKIIPVRARGVEPLVNHKPLPLPVFFLSVDYKRLSDRVTRLESTVADDFVGVDSKELVTATVARHTASLVGIANTRLNP